MEEQQWRRERVSSGSVFSNLNVGEDKLSIGEGQERYLYPLGPNGHLSAALPYPRRSTAVQAKIGDRI